MGEKILRKNEIRKDLNPDHYNKYGSPHDAVITARKKHKLKANTKTHAKFVNGVETLDIDKDSIKPQMQHERYSPPFWQHENKFGEKQTKKVPKRTLRKIKKYNRKFDV